MRLVTFSHEHRTRLGAVVARDGQAGVLDLSAARPDLPAEMLAFLAAGEAALAGARSAVAGAAGDCCLPIGALTLLAPLPRPGKIIGLGHNYHDHIGIGRSEPAPYPTLFCKTANTVIGPGQPILIPPETCQVDYEAELAVVIGKPARRVEQARALKVVAGYTIFNDVSARDYQKRSSQWMFGKSFDTFGPLGPALVTSDEIPDPHGLELSLTLNGREMQHSNTAHMIFSIPYLIAYLSAVMTLEPGDVISTGTPAKTSLAQSLPAFMQPGDVVSISIERIGVLTNPVMAAAS